LNNQIIQNNNETEEERLKYHNLVNKLAKKEKLKMEMDATIQNLENRIKNYKSKEDQ